MLLRSEESGSPVWVMSREHGVSGRYFFPYQDGRRTALLWAALRLCGGEIDHLVVDLDDKPSNYLVDTEGSTITRFDIQSLITYYKRPVVPGIQYLIDDRI